MSTNTRFTETDVQAEVDELRQLVELKTLLAESEDTDLEDDRAVSELRDRVDTLEIESSLVETQPETKLRAETIIPEKAVNKLSEKLDDDDTEQVFDLYEALEKIGPQPNGTGRDLKENARESNLSEMRTLARLARLDLKKLLPPAFDGADV